MATYLDTSVIVARYLPSDPNLNAVEKFFTQSAEAKYISEISVLELYCVFSRLIAAAQLTTPTDIHTFNELTVDEKVRTAVEHAVRTWRAKVVMPERTVVKLPVWRQTLEVQEQIFEALRYSPKLGLKTLDALHLAYARAIKELTLDLETFTTLDKDLSARSMQIEKEMDIRIVSPLSYA
jgi:predicted nucleic acid-binding protein